MATVKFSFCHEILRVDMKIHASTWLLGAKCGLAHKIGGRHLAQISKVKKMQSEYFMIWSSTACIVWHLLQITFEKLLFSSSYHYSWWKVVSLWKTGTVFSGLENLLPTQPFQNQIVISKDSFWTFDIKVSCNIAGLSWQCLVVMIWNWSMKNCKCFS